MGTNRKDLLDKSECAAAAAELTMTEDSARPKRIAAKTPEFDRLNSAADRLERTERLLLCALRVWEHNNLKR